MEAERPWLSADWGTSNFRLRLIGGASLQVLDEISEDQGISLLHQRWKQTGSPGNSLTEAARFAFYLRYLLEKIREIETRNKKSFDGCFVMLSGMAGSTIGMMTLPYQQMPCPADGSGLNIFLQQASDGFPFPLALVSGVCNDIDVMRGEETMLIGAADQAPQDQSGAWFVFPGTHSKHLMIKNGQITQLRTYMTGEVFSLLAEKSILSASVEKTETTREPAAFAAGVTEGARGRLMHSIFSVRTSDLFGKAGRGANYSFLSGLLIGHELRDLEEEKRIVLVGSGFLRNAYESAIRVLMPSCTVTFVDAAAALIRGQWKIANKVFAEK